VTGEPGEPRPSSRRLWRRVGHALVALVLVYLVYRLVVGWEELVRQGVTVRPSRFVLAVLAYLLVRATAIGNWGWMVGRGGRRIPYRISFSVCARAWIGRYLPGKLWVVGGKIWLGQRLGLPRRRVAVVSLLELAVGALSALTWGGLFLLAARLVAGVAVPLLPVAALFVAGALGIAPPVFRRLLNLAIRVLRRPPLEPRDMLSVRDLLIAYARHLGVGAIAAGSWLILISAVLPPETRRPAVVLVVLGAAPLSGLLGMLTAFSPAGLGVREGSFAALATTVLPAEAAIALVLLDRFRTVLGDLAQFGLASFLSRRGRRSEGPPADHTG
jgi:hypothetical protein